MNMSSRWALALAIGAVGVPAHAATIELDGVRLDDSAQVAGKSLTLNGAGISARLVFKVYAISLYLLERRSTVEGVLSNDGPRRVVILMLRDVSGEEFRQAMMDSLPAHGDRLGGAPTVAAGMMQLGMSIASRPNGLRKGDTLTLDWIPEVGTVVELNKRPLLEPILDRGVYNALLNIWLGASPADPSLKSKLLGRYAKQQALAD
jgi:hypothetical protein